MLSSLVDLKPNISAMVDSTMAVLTRGASRILIDSIAIDLQLLLIFSSRLSSFAVH